jgi:hypothetical protein
MLYALLLLGLGLVTTGYGVHTHRLRRRMLAWPVARGRLLEKRAAPAQGPAPGPPAFNWEATVRYEYEAAGKTWTGTRLHLGRFVHTQENAERLLAGIPDAPEVRWDPADPGTAYLLPPPAGWAPVLLALGPLLLLGGGATLLVALAP